MKGGFSSVKVTLVAAAQNRQTGLGSVPDIQILFCLKLREVVIQANTSLVQLIQVNVFLQAIYT